jgi:hypothetical protein
MSDDSEEYERSRDEANRLAGMETQLEPGLAEPHRRGLSPSGTSIGTRSSI